MMSAVDNPFDRLKALVQSAHKCTTSEQKVNFYDSWADTYEQDVAVLEYHAPTIITNIISTHFTGDLEAAIVLDVACGTGLVAKMMKNSGFRQFVGIDGSEVMLEAARKGGLYQELTQSMLGDKPLPFQMDSFDVVVIAGALSASHVPITVVRELCRCTKPGGYICLSTRGDLENLVYKSTLELELKKMEDERLWSCVEVTEVEEFERAVSDKEDGYIPGAVYLYQKLAAGPCPSM